MRLAWLSKSLVAAVLAAGCGSPQREVTTGGGGSGDTAAPPRFDASARWRFVSVLDLLARHTPVPADTVGLYLFAPSCTNCVVTVKGPAMNDACAQTAAAECRAIQSGQGRDMTLRLLAITRDGTMHWLPWSVLHGPRDAATDVDRAVLQYVLANGATVGEWVWIDGGAQVHGERIPEVLQVPYDAQVTLPPVVEQLDAPLPSPVTVSLSALHQWAYDTHGVQLHELDPAGPVVAGLPPVERAIVRAMGIAQHAMMGAQWVRVRPLLEGWLVDLYSDAGGCGPPPMSATVAVVAARAVVVDQRQGMMSDACRPRGRRPPGLAAAPGCAPDVAGFLAHAAWLEAASVPAFERLAAELAALGAPADLIARARAAADDEVRHAAVMAAHAGTVIAPVELAATPPRSAFDVALDNAVEGCVHEAFAAVLCRHQAAAATDPALAADLAAIADDECAHGDLAWDLAAWLEPRLTPAERAQVAAARAAALASLPGLAVREATHLAPAAAALGLPSPSQAAHLAAAFSAAARAHSAGFAAAGAP